MEVHCEIGSTSWQVQRTALGDIRNTYMHVLNSKIRSHTKIMGWGAEAMLPCSTQAFVEGASLFYSLSGLLALPATAQEAMAYV